MTSPKIRVFLERNPFNLKGRLSRDYSFESCTLGGIFWELCSQKTVPPTQKEFLPAYLCAGIVEAHKKKIPLADLKRRASNAWATFIRELDFYCQIRDCGLFQRVEKDVSLDQRLGYDLVVRWGDQSFYVHLFFDTPNARYYMKRKHWRKYNLRKEKGLPSPIEFPLDKMEADTVGNTYLYTQEHLVVLRGVLIQHSRDE